MASLEEAKRDWNDLGRLDPYWAVLVEPTRRYGGWETPEGREAFFRSGEVQVDGLLREIATAGLALHRGVALDFGCGVGRLTRALSARFERCVGVDISESMIERAREMNADRPNIDFRVNAAADLRLLPDGSCDLVYSSIVLQHVPGREAILGYVRDFVRLLRPGGVVAFQLPSHIPLRRRIQPRRRLYGALRALGLPSELLYNSMGLVGMRMSAVPEEVVVRTLREAGAQVATVGRDAMAGAEIESRTYLAVKPGPGGRTGT